MQSRGKSVFLQLGMQHGPSRSMLRKQNLSMFLIGFQSFFLKQCNLRYHFLHSSGVQMSQRKAMIKHL
jgi:hypothetical protein